MNLSPINISLLAPAGAGKTTLIATIMRDTKSALPAPFKVEPSTSYDELRIAEFNRQLQASIDSGEFSFNHGALINTQEINLYNYKISFKELEQPFSLMDFPGHWVTPVGNEERPTDQWKQYQTHLQNSAALWVPVEATLLMEAHTPAEIRKASRLLGTTDVRDNVENWAKYRAMNEHRDEPAALYLAPIKCETYFSKAQNQDVPRRFFDAFVRKYSEIIDVARNNCPHCRIYYAPVESIGCIKLQKMDWKIDEGNDIFPVVSYTILPPYYQQITGVEALTASIYRFGAERIKDALAEMRDGKAIRRSCEIDAYNSRGFFARVFDWFSGEGDRKEASIHNLTVQVEEMEADLERLSEELENLANRSNNAKYFQQLV